MLQTDWQNEINTKYRSNYKTPIHKTENYKPNNQKTRFDFNLVWASSECRCVSTFRPNFPTIFKMASGNLLDRLVWQFRHLWRDGNKARLSIESDHDGNAYASLHVDLGQGRRRPRQVPPPLPTHPPKSRHSQTQPLNISKDLNRSTQVVTTGKSVTPCVNVGTQASDTVEVATDTV